MLEPCSLDDNGIRFANRILVSKRERHPEANCYLL
jgi:hypothetical protein